jgi:hypothetical protein
MGEAFYFKKWRFVGINFGLEIWVGFCWSWGVSDRIYEKNRHHVNLFVSMIDIGKMLFLNPWPATITVIKEVHPMLNHRCTGI